MNPVAKPSDRVTLKGYLKGKSAEYHLIIDESCSLTELLFELEKCFFSSRGVLPKQPHCILLFGQRRLFKEELQMILEFLSDNFEIIITEIASNNEFTRQSIQEMGLSLYDDRARESDSPLLTSPVAGLTSKPDAEPAAKPEPRDTIRAMPPPPESRENVRVISPPRPELVTPRSREANVPPPLPSAPPEQPRRRLAESDEPKEEYSPPIPEATLTSPGFVGENALIFTKTLRSGQRIVEGENIVIIGDVNPGAEVISCKNIMVFGALRGIAHAGMPDDRGAIIMANSLHPMQIRIGDILTRAPATNHKSKKDTDIPEIAYIQDDQIVLEPLKNHRF
jgi:septum formation inhibitor MinC